MKLTLTELATVLAALRYWQRMTDEATRGNISEHFDEEEPLTDDDIDELCEKLNVGSGK
jgi:hypothetical protein